MFLKFIKRDGQELTVQTNSYQVTENSPEIKFVLANVVRSGVGNSEENPTEFRLCADSWETMYVMNDRGETVDRVHISIPPLPPDTGK